MPPTLILINPWIYDFAAYDLWSKPLGLLYLAGYLRKRGYSIHLIDCLDVHHPKMISSPSMKMPVRRSYGTGKYWRKKVAHPKALKNIPRPYSRYGISKKIVEEELKRVQKPAAILVTSLMTYWYPGVRDVISLAKKIHPGVPIISGGIYARLCHNHAVKILGADHVVAENDPAVLLKILNNYDIPAQSGTPFSDGSFYPAFDLLTKNDYICILTSTGCPYRCAYCATRFLNPESVRRNPEDVLEEIIYWHKTFNIRDFAFYDDALLIDFDTHLGVLLERLAGLGLSLRFHTPNALHIKKIGPETARLLKYSGFVTIRLGLETSDFSLHRDLDNKVAEGDFENAVTNLLKAGFTGDQIGAYILIGLPGQSVSSVFDTINFVAGAGASPFLSEYSPLPHTRLWQKAMEHSHYDLASEPLFHNNTLLPCWDNSRKEKLSALKNRVLQIRQDYL